MNLGQNLNYQLAISEHKGVISTETDNELVMRCHGEQNRRPSFSVTSIDGASYHQSNNFTILLHDGLLQNNFMPKFSQSVYSCYLAGAYNYKK